MYNYYNSYNWHCMQPILQPAVGTGQWRAVNLKLFRLDILLKYSKSDSHSLSYFLTTFNSKY